MLKPHGVTILHKGTAVRHALSAEKAGCDIISIDDFFTNVERAADIAQRRASAIADHRRRDRRTLAPERLENVLDHLLAPAVFEVDVDVGPFGRASCRESVCQYV